MKKIKLLLLALLATSVMFGQELKIDTLTDDMSDRISYSVNEDILCMAEDNSKGFRITPLLKVYRGALHITNLIVTFAGLESCNENNKLIILFEDGEKLQLVSWNKFNCKSTAYFSVLPKYKKKLINTPIKKVRMTNGRSNKSYTHEIEVRDYFVELYNLIK